MPENSDSSFWHLLSKYSSKSDYEIIESSSIRSKQESENLKLLLQGENGRDLPSDCSLVLFGSYARNEVTEESDLDWGVLIDGQVNDSHMEYALLVEERLKSSGKKMPGSSGVFGNLFFSHDIVHQIGGTTDTNENTTRRILLLLESTPLLGVEVWKRVIRAVLQRYFQQSVHFSPKHRRVPRFLLNDIVRLWRTMCVDYASKYQAQGGNKWALRNIKLRFSRKLIFSAGLCFCFACELSPDFDQESQTAEFINFGLEFALRSPMMSLVEFIDSYCDSNCKADVARAVIEGYASFLRALNDSSTRSTLESLSIADAEKSPAFSGLRTEGDRFSHALELLFFGKTCPEDPKTVIDLATRYALF